VCLFLLEETSSGAEEPGSKRRRLWLQDCRYPAPSGQSTSEEFHARGEAAEVLVCGAYVWVCRAATHSSCKGLELAPGKLPGWSRPCLLQASCRGSWRWLLGVPSTGLGPPQETSARNPRWEPRWCKRRIAPTAFRGFTDSGALGAFREELQGWSGT